MGNGESGKGKKIGVRQRVAYALLYAIVWFAFCLGWIGSPLDFIDPEKKEGK